ncbi:helix-turn-helix transcriptional regulator [Halomonas sp. RA08-2]|uniref:helix-turn-helix transcriptional regulator n=1 Tax=Halomonas sp. RA08-2 TaxID=3440842 RepID=UPI003EE86716
MKYYSDKQLAERFGVTRSTIWRWVKIGLLPAPVRLTKGCTRWRSPDIEAWEESREVADHA